MTKQPNCILCGKEFESDMERNNPYPVSETGDCCEQCNWNKVLPARLAKFGIGMTSFDKELEDHEESIGKS